MTAIFENLFSWMVVRFSRLLSGAERQMTSGCSPRTCYVVVFLMSLKIQRKSVAFVRVLLLLRLVSFLAFAEKAFLFFLCV